MTRLTREHKILAGILITMSVVAGILITANSMPTTQGDDTSEFPDFYTSNSAYFVTRIGSIPQIDRDSYRLNIRGLIDNPRTFTLAELQELDMIELPLTVECIGNGVSGRLLGTAIWKGFSVYALLDSLGIQEGATGVRYSAADNYYTSNTLEQVENDGVLGALYMNGEEIPPNQGFPLRILNPGYYGAKHPMWVIDIEVIDRPLENYWDERGWNTAPLMEIDSKIFFPHGTISVNMDQTLKVGGCAYGGTRVKLVEYTLDDGLTWNNASIVQQIDADNIWVFWEAEISFSDAGQVTLQIRATDINDNQQPETDSTFFDGINSRPQLTINVVSD